jgi:hypothetical protein
MLDSTFSPSAVLDEVLAGDSISLAQGAKLLPATRGKATAPSTLFRWHVRGVKLPDGTTLKLEAVRIAGRLVTSKAALRRFIERQNQPQQPPVPIPEVRTPTERRKAVASAVAACAARGL